MSEWFPYLMSFLGMAFSAICTIVVAKIQKDSNKQREVDDKREERRQKESRLSMQMIYASMELGDVNAVALQNGKLNGNVEEARLKAKQAREKYQQFLVDVASEVI